MNSKKYYPDVDPKPNFPKLEERILTFWNESDIFRESVENRLPGKDGKNEFVFYDGPPFANGLPHYGHLLTGFIKDVIPRYMTMRGKRVERRFGWDCHGLPVEMEAEKLLKISGRNQIQNYGIQKFNEYCHSSVLRYTDEWKYFVNRQGRWVDFDNDYKTMDLSFTESVLWAFKQLWDKGLIYEKYRVMPYCWSCQTPLSNFETRLDDSYRKRQDPAVTVLFTLDNSEGENKTTKMLVWTTTPWTLPSNLALAVGRNIEYAIFEEKENRYIIAETARKRYSDLLADAKFVGHMKGEELVGRTYKPIFSFFSDNPNSFRVLIGEFVNTEEGTGIVHLAPGFGEDDQQVCDDNGIPIVCPVDDEGQFTNEIPPYHRMMVFDANKQIIKDLKNMGILFKFETYVHEYPHCWRSDHPLIYKAVNSWYVKVTKFRDRMVELNKKISWIPDHIRDGLFGNWLENAKDWSISRNRFWGAPIPVWCSDDQKYPRIDVYGSLDEIERDFGVRPVNFHRPFIDQLVRPNPDDPTGKSMMRRVDEVLDCWFESGSMPFAQIHYPFENKEWFENHFPADFITEYVAQTRGWFYTLIVLGTALFDKPPFLNAICHGVILDENGSKLSKRLRNYPSPEEVFSNYGADALRWFLISSQVSVGKNLQIDREGKIFGEVIKEIINPIWNAYYFFCLYANLDNIKAKFRTDSKNILDRYILAKTHYLVTNVAKHMDTYDLPDACQVVKDFMEALNNWYIRRSRNRFWKSDMEQDKIQAYDTLYTVLHILCRVSCPLLPFITEEVYRGITAEKSVHLSDWPDISLLPENPKLVEEMDLVREICSTALSIREKHNLRIRLPLKSLTVAGQGVQRISPYLSIIKEEVNVKEILISETIERFATHEILINPKKVGPRFGSSIKKIMDAAKQGKWKTLEGGRAEVSDEILEADEFTTRLVPKNGLAAQTITSSNVIVILDVSVDGKQEEEGIVRDLIRLVQTCRKEANLNISDRIVIVLDVPADIGVAINSFSDYFKEQTLASDLKIGTQVFNDMFVSHKKIDEIDVTIAIKKIS